ncbi:MAG: proteasome accessory factor PafA2 family protein [Nitrospirota bacterium]|nr:proteasome accessory factor PafA2 family protein [Nitrospirota bacterium]
MTDRPFLLGSETEFGISCADPREQNHITNSLQLVGFCPGRPAPECLWDYAGENPLLDLFGSLMEGEREDPDLYANRALNKPLANGGRLYVDGAHPEYSTPEVSDPLDLVRFETAGERIADACRKGAERATGRPRFALHKNNSDGKGNSYGYHENYLVVRGIPAERLIRGLVPHFVTRTVFCGAGKVGSEHGREACRYQMSQRADFFEALAELNTMVRRPLFNTRNEPHADPERWLRLHVIPGDSNMSQVSTFLKVGTTALILRLIEDDALGDVPWPADPVEAFRAVSRDLALGRVVDIEGGGSMSAIDIQRVYLERVKAYAARHPLPGSFPLVVERWEKVLNDLEADPMSPDREVDWVIKYRMIDTYLTHKGLDWSHPRARAMDLQYHDVDLAKGLYHTLEKRGMVDILVTPAEIAAAQEQPPVDTRAWFRGQCLARFGKGVYGVSWSSVLLDTGEEVRRIPMLDPFRGTRDVIGELLDASATPAELVARLEGNAG